MSAIDPELLPENLPGLKEKYRDETPEQSAARSQRYKKAFAEYDTQYAVYMAELESRVRAYQRQAVASVEQEDRRDDEADISALEQSISSL